MKKLVSFVILLILGLAMTGCGGETKEKAKTIGISMPTKSSQRWIDDGNNMVAKFEELGYKTNLQYAEDVVENQIAQIENMITRGVSALVVAAVDGEALSDVLRKAGEAGIPVISYDRLIRNSGDVSYYATFDNFKVGVLQGTYIVEALDLENAKKPLNIEIFAGSPDDNNAYFFFDGAMSVLNPYIKSGKLVVKSGQTEFSQAATLRWDGATAQSRMDNLLSRYYGKNRVDAVLSPYDGISIGIISSLKGIGYGSAGQPMPVITGQDAELPSVKSILMGEQTSTVFKDTRILADRAVKMMDAVLKGETPEVNDTETYDNGVKIVPAYLEVPESVDKSNIEEVLIDSGYYSADQLK